ncbi:MAG: NAD-dependent malic enzyme [Acidimicrobiaceae bacterium]|nr:NAD-dependent malic enzyme [Acidimicrobiaceae bacterium]
MALWGDANSVTGVPNAPTAAYSITLKVSLDNIPGTLARFATAVGDAGGNIAAIPGFEAKGPNVVRDIDVHCRSETHAELIASKVAALEGVTVLDWWDRTFALHEGGKIEVLPLCSVGDADDLAMAYTPGVARVCLSIREDRSLSHRYTIKKNSVAIVSDGSAVLGLGNIGAFAAMPVMEGKALLFKEFGGVDGFPICLNTQDPEEIIETITHIAPTFGGINIEDIAAPACFEIEERLKATLPIPVFHDDQHGTAIVVLAALTNALRLVDKNIGAISAVISGMGAAGVAVGKILVDAGVGEVIGVDRIGAVYTGRGQQNKIKDGFAAITNPDRKIGTLADVLVGADVFIGVSAPNLIDAANLRLMARDPIVFALANPEPEIRPEIADGIAAVMATGRSDFPNQINNVLAFPGMFRGALDVCAHSITENMKVSAAQAIAACVPETELRADFVVPSVFDRTVAPLVAKAVADAAVQDGVASGQAVKHLPG